MQSDNTDLSGQIMWEKPSKRGKINCENTGDSKRHFKMSATVPRKRSRQRGKQYRRSMPKQPVQALQPLPCHLRWRQKSSPQRSTRRRTSSRKQCSQSCSIVHNLWDWTYLHLNRRMCKRFRQTRRCQTRNGRALSNHLVEKGVALLPCNRETWRCMPSSE